MLYTYFKENLNNYTKTLEDPDLADYTDLVVSYILLEAISANNSHTFIFHQDKSEEFISKVITNIRRIFIDCLVIAHVVRNFDEKILESGVTVYWGT